MALEKQTVVDKIEVLENGCVKYAPQPALEDGVQLSQSYHRHVVAPGDDYSGEDARVQAICAATHTAEVVAAYQAAIEAANSRSLKMTTWTIVNMERDAQQALYQPCIGLAPMLMVTTQALPTAHWACLVN
jgi:hypothetical protein